MYVAQHRQLIKVKYKVCITFNTLTNNQKLIALMAQILGLVTEMYLDYLHVTHIQKKLISKEFGKV